MRDVPGRGDTVEILRFDRVVREAGHADLTVGRR
jgi:hypothetical protein